MKGRLEDKVALVTGGGAGIGRASALALAREGASVVVADLDMTSGLETVGMIRDSGCKSLFVKTDVSHAGEVEALVSEAVATYGRLDCAFNNAGIEGPTEVPTAEYGEEDWDRVISVNLKGVWLCLKYEISQMLKQGGGAIVNMASIVGLVGGSLSGAAYVASKHGVIGLTKAAVLEYGNKNIRINAVCPGLIRTRMGESFLKGDPEMEEALTARHPLGRLGTPDEVAETVVWLCSDAASFVTGQALAVDGGYLAQ